MKNTEFIFVITLLKVTLGVQITRLSVPSAVLNGSVGSLTLDCHFKLDPGDQLNNPLQPNQSGPVVSGLVVKWFLNDRPEPVYQWTPGYRPQAFGPLKGRVDLGHATSEDSLQKYRAIRLCRPGVELSGSYTCRVTTWSDVAVATKRMTIYAPVKHMKLWSSEPHHHVTQLTCEAVGAFPEPRISFIVQDSQMSRFELDALHVTRTARASGGYSVMARRSVDDRSLPRQCLIFCHLVLPGTDYSASEKILHIRGTPSHSSFPVNNTTGRNLGRPLQYFPDALYGSAASVANSPATCPPVIFLLLITILNRVF